jgi:hypothetical protein
MRKSNVEYISGDRVGYDCVHSCKFNKPDESFHICDLFLNDYKTFWRGGGKVGIRCIIISNKTNKNRLDHYRLYNNNDYLIMKIPYFKLQSKERIEYK